MGKRKLTMEDWLNRPENAAARARETNKQAMRTDLTPLEKLYAVEGTERDLREMQMAEAPDEYLEPSDLEDRLERRRALETEGLNRSAGGEGAQADDAGLAGEGREFGAEGGGEEGAGGAMAEGGADGTGAAADDEQRGLDDSGDIDGGGAGRVSGAVGSGGSAGAAAGAGDAGAVVTTTGPGGRFAYAPGEYPQSTLTNLRSAIGVLNELRAGEVKPGEASVEQLRELARYGGAVDIKSVFDPRAKGHDAALMAAIRKIAGIKFLDTEASMQNAHFTTPDIARAMWRGMLAAGMTSGNILEPGAGIGVFAGSMPAGAQGMRMHMVERDPVASSIAKYLYPRDAVKEMDLRHFEEENQYDGAIGNVPFGKVILRVKGQQHSIHNAAILKTLHAIRPGSYAALITSRFTLDASNPRSRKAMAELADLKAVVRLPMTAFAKNAKTSVITDILVFQKKVPGRHSVGLNFIDAVERIYIRPKVVGAGMKDARVPYYVNQVIDRNLARIIGRESNTGVMYGSKENYNVESELELEAIAEEAAKALLKTFDRQKLKDMTPEEKKQKLLALAKKVNVETEGLSMRQIIDKIKAKRDEQGVVC